jgi:enoyl-CoA hydratase/carnithine racemase
MGGIFQKIVTNKMSLSGVPTGLTPTTIGEILRVTKRPGASAANKLAMAGQNAINAASAWPVGAIQVSPREKQWGYDIKTVITPYGNLDLVYDDTLAQEYGLADKLVVIDENHVRETMLRGLGMQLIQKVVSLSTTHRIVDAITSTFGMQLQNEELFALIKDI